MADERYLRMKEVKLQEEATAALVAIRARLDAHDAAHARTHDLLADLSARLDAAATPTPTRTDAGPRQRKES